MNPVRDKTLEVSADSSASRVSNGMKVVIATPLYPPEIGGPATYAKLLEDRLPGEDIEIEVVKFNDVRHLPKVIRHYVYYRRVLRAARDADMILALDPVSVGLPAMHAAKKSGKPLVLKVGGDYAWEQGQQRFGVSQTLNEFIETDKVPLLVRALRYIQARVALHATRVITPSNYLKEVVVSWGVPEHKVEVIYNAVSLDEIGSVPAEIAALPRPLVVSVGRLVPWKQVDGVIDAIGEVRGRGVEASLAVVGEGPEHGRLLQYAEDRLGSKYLFTGALPHPDTLAVMKSADVLVLNSSYEGLSHLLIEAGMLGVPTIATRVGGNEEVMTHEQDGLLVQNGDGPALADALVRLLSDKHLRTYLSSNARASSMIFSVNGMVKSSVELFVSIL